MAGITGPVTGSQVQGYIKQVDAYTAKSGSEYAATDFVGNGKLVTDANKADVLDPLDALGGQPNSQSYGVFGLQAKRRLAGQPDPADFTVRLEFNSVEKAKLVYKTGVKVEFAMHAKDAGGETTIVQQTTVASKQIEFQIDGPAIVLLGLSPFGDIIVVDKA